MSLNRTLAPEFKTINTIDLLEAKPLKLDNGTPLYVINAGSQELTRIEFVFKGGAVYQSKPLVAQSTNNMLKEGTKTYTAMQIAEALDFYGAFLENNTDKHYSNVTVYSLNKHLPSVLPYLKSMLTEPAFPEKELGIYISNQKQSFLVKQKKVDHIVRTEFPSKIFGESHPYGNFAKEADYDALTAEEIKAFYKLVYAGGPEYILVSGKVDESIIRQLNDFMGQWKHEPFKGTELNFEPQTNGKGKELLERKEAIQSAIRIGRVMFNKTHPDYLPFQVLNTVLGGYFGSRLMANIREDKGYTYGIGSAISSLNHSGVFFISTEVGVDVCKDALKEIYFEIDRLRNELIPAEELETVKNYMLGVFLRSADGPFALADKFKGIYEYGLGYDFYQQMVKTVSTVTPQQLKDLANQYLKQEDLFELVVGKI